MNRAGGLLKAASVVVSLLAAAQGLAAEAAGDDGLGYGFTVSAVQSDNIGRESENKDSDTAAAAGLFAVVRYERERQSLVLDADLRFESHSFESYGDTLSGGLAVLGTYGLLRERVIWVVEDNFGQAFIESRAIATPDNSQNLNVFSTGPDIRLPMGPRTSFALRGRWTDVSFEESNYGNRRLLADVGLVRQMGERSSLALIGSTEHVNYKSLGSESDYDVHNAYVAWEATGARTELELTIGYSALEEEAGTAGSGTFGLALSRRVTARSTLSVHAGRGFEDSASSLAREQGIRGVSIGGRPAAVSADPFKSDHATVAWRLDGERSSLSTLVNWRRESHRRDSDLDRRALDAGLEVSRRLSPRLTGSFGTGYAREDFSNSAIEFSEWSVGLGLGWLLTPTFSTSLDWGRFQGSGDSTLGPETRDYVENRYTFNLTWSPER